MDTHEIITLPLVPLKGMNIFPEMLLSFDAERPMSIGALNAALKSNNLIFITAQKDFTVEEPELTDLYTIGTVCRIRQQLKVPQGNLYRVMIEGMYRAEIVSIEKTERCLQVKAQPLPDLPDRISQNRLEALLRSVVSLFEEYLQSVPEAANEQILNVLANPEPNYIISYIAQNLQIEVEDKQTVLECRSVSKKLNQIVKLLNHELQVLAIEKELNKGATDAMNKAQREYMLREQMRIIQNELGGSDAEIDDVSEYRRKIEELDAPEEVKTKLQKELGRMAKQPFGSSEAAVQRNYLDVALEIPWGKYTQETLDLDKARKTLDEDHYGLDKVKERIIEYLAVKKLSQNVKGGLLCFVGPPGTGKTSIAMSIARTLNRKLVRVSLGGVHDEAEIRGHRKTYIGSMPGRIINGLIQAGSMNPLMVLDEIDKLGHDYRGDPAAALLETLDGEQNSAFRDNFLEFPVDISNVFFITTANSLDTVPRALLDRMEVIELSSYTDEEKFQIAKKHLLPKQRKKHALNGNQLRISDTAMHDLIRLYTRESGVRSLEREIASVCRKAAAGIAEGRFNSLQVKPAALESLLGPAPFKKDEHRVLPEVGIVRGLAYTSVGGEVLDVEAIVLEGNGKLEVTGNLGDVMKESVRAAVSFIRSRADKLGIPADFYKTKDIHIHFPEAAVPKDGPSAGITICMAVISALTGIPVNQDVCMTGEITLRGRILPIGGLKEKTMAAYRTGMKKVIIPEDNIPDLEKIDQTVRAGLEFIPTDCADKVFDTVFVTNPLKQIQETCPGVLGTPVQKELRA